HPQPSGGGAHGPLPHRRPSDGRQPGAAGTGQGAGRGRPRGRVHPAGPGDPDRAPAPQLGGGRGPPAGPQAGRGGDGRPGRGRDPGGRRPGREPLAAGGGRRRAPGPPRLRPDRAVDLPAGGVALAQGQPPGHPRAPLPAARGPRRRPGADAQPQLTAAPGSARLEGPAGDGAVDRWLGGGAPDQPGSRARQVTVPLIGGSAAVPMAGSSTLAPGWMGSSRLTAPTPTRSPLRLNRMASHLSGRPALLPVLATRNSRWTWFWLPSTGPSTGTVALKSF